MRALPQFEVFQGPPEHGMETETIFLLLGLIMNGVGCSHTKTVDLGYFLRSSVMRIIFNLQK